MAHSKDTGTKAQVEMTVPDAATADERPSLRAWIGSLPLVPLPLLGMSIFRGWLVVVCDGDLTRDSGFEHAFGGFDIIILITMLACLANVRRLTPLWRHRWAGPVSIALMMAASLLGYGFLGVEVPPFALAVAFNVLVGTGTALMTLLWFEAYSCLTPARACLCYAMTIGVGGLIGWLFRGFSPETLPVASALLPPIALRCLWNAHRQQDAPLRLPAGWASFSFPWKPVLVIAVFSFAYGMLQPAIYTVSTRSASVSTILCALIIALLVLIAHDRIEFSSIYAWLMPTVVAVSLVLAAVPGLNVWWSNFFANLAYTTSCVYIVTTLCSLSYHWGVSAVWLFGIEEIANLASMLAGRAAVAGLNAAGLPVAPLLVMAVLAATVIALRERRSGSAWGIRLAAEQADAQASQEARERTSLMGACATLARSCGLSQREEEVLRLLADHKTARDIERELGVANGTAKAHIRHVYQKLDIHTREELFDQVERARG